MSSNQTIIIKKIKKGGGHGHHGGAWKVAYADFVTAMMAFFLLLWLLSSTSKEQKEGIAEYFNPTIALGKTGGGAGLMGGEAPSEKPMNTDPFSTPFSPIVNQHTANAEKDMEEAEDSEKEMAKASAPSAEELEEQRFQKAAQTLRQAIQEIPELNQLADSLIIDNTPEGLRIQIVDQEKRSMFPSGSAKMFSYANKLMTLVSQVVRQMPNQIAIGGHTDAVPFSSESNYSNWELSADRANASRQALINAGIPEDHISRVSGYADRELLDKEDPASSRNRRISILLLREAKSEGEELQGEEE